jgi:hypothetical protein
MGQYVIRRQHPGYGLLYLRGDDPRSAAPHWDLGLALRFGSAKEAQDFLARMPTPLGGKEQFEVFELPAG